MKRAVVIGAGPAGLTAAYELLRDGTGTEVVILEESGCIGGISKTVVHDGNRMDMGGHRFFSKDPRVNRLWEEWMPMQSAPAKDDILLQREAHVEASGADPEKEDRVMLYRHRVSRIFFNDKFYDYPISLKAETIKNMGFWTTMQVGFSYLGAVLRKLPEDNLENYYINRFGKKLYSMFFEYYTENLWGRHPREIDASWGAQRVKGLSVIAILKDIGGKLLHKKNRKVETSLIEEFKYPKLGPGQLWEMAAEKVREMGGSLILHARVCGLETKDGNVTSVIYEKDGKQEKLDADYVISSMPLKDLVAGMPNVPEEISAIAAGLPYRDYLTLGVLVPRLALQNKTKMKTVGNIVPDCWIYVQDRRVKLGRVQIYNNWSPYLVKDVENTVWVGLEYFAQEGDALWTMSPEEFTRLGIEEMVKVGLITDPASVLDTHIEKVKKAYPAYFDTYSEIDKLRDYLDSFANLYCVGRNGQHRYNNMDHSMATSMEAVKCILSGNTDKSEIWNVNTEKEYHEEKQEEHA